MLVGLILDVSLEQKLYELWIECVDALDVFAQGCHQASGGNDVDFVGRFVDCLLVCVDVGDDLGDQDDDALAVDLAAVEFVLCTADHDV